MIEGWLIDADYVTQGGRAVVRLWCKDEEGVFVAYDPSFKPYFYVLGVDEETIEKAVVRRREVITPEGYEIVKAKILGKSVEAFKVYARHPQHVPALREYFSQFGEVREADIPFAYRYLIDKDLACMDGVRIEGKEMDGVLRSYEVEHVERVRRMEFPELKILAFDCEMLSSFGMPDPEKDPIIVVSYLRSDDEEPRIISGNEREIIRSFVKVIKDFDPDLIVGYNQDAFDWPYIRRRAERWNLPLEIGRDGSTLTFRGGRPKIVGRLNVDLYDIAMKMSEVKVKKLENVAEYLGTKVEIADIEAKDIYKYWTKGEREKVFEYAKQDVLNTWLIAKELLPMHYELSKMIRLPVDDVTRSGRGKQVDWLLLSEARKLNEIAPNPPEVAESYEGAFVLEPARGLHENVACLDFASMYPSIIIAFNISPDTLGCSEDCNVAPEVGHRFRKKPEGFITRIIRILIEERRKIKEEMKKHDYDSPEYKLLDVKQQTLKVLTNSFYGYMGWNMARWYCRECAEATTAWGRHFIKKSARIATEMGFEVLYGDTDSIFVKMPGKGLEELEKHVEKLIERLSREMPIQIEVDEYYRTIFFVEKKRYAGLTVDGRMIVRGLEVRRGDWCELAKRVQSEVLEIILKERDPEKAARHVRKVVEMIKNGRVKLEDIIIYKGLTKKPTKYEAMQAHVKAALRAMEMGIVYPVGSKVGFIVVKGSGSVGDRAYPVDLVEDFDGENVRIKTRSGYEVKKIDKVYYIDHQIIPAVSRILERFGYTESSLKGSSQLSLDSFFQ